MFSSNPFVICQKACVRLVIAWSLGCFSLWGALWDACWTIGCWAPTVSSMTGTWVTYCSPVMWSSVTSPLSFTFLLREQWKKTSVKEVAHQGSDTAWPIGAKYQNRDLTNSDCCPDDWQSVAVSYCCVVLCCLYPNPSYLYRMSSGAGKDSPGQLRKQLRKTRVAIPDHTHMMTRKDTPRS